MIKICKQYTKESKKHTTIYCDIYIENEKKTIWFEVSNEYKDYLCLDRADAYLIGLLNFAMRHNYDISCEMPVSEELLYNIRTTLIPSLAKYGRDLHSITINAVPIKNITDGKNIGTGCSCGIDSFYSISSHIKTEYKNMDLTHLVINNVGSFDYCYSNINKQSVIDERYRSAEELDKELDNYHKEKEAKNESEKDVKMSEENK